MIVDDGISKKPLLRQALANKIPFCYVVNDVWYTSADNMLFDKHDLKRELVMPLKTNRKVALSLKAKKQGQYAAGFTHRFRYFE